MNTKKIKVTLPYYIYEIVEKDIEHFSLNRNRLCNYIFEFCKDDYEPIEIRSKFSKTIQFNLNKNNFDIYEDFLIENSIENEASFFRSIFTIYAGSPRYLREKIVFTDIFQTLKSSIKYKKCVKIKYNGKFRIIEPYFISNVDNEAHNYLFSYCHKNQNYVNYKVASIKSIIPLAKNQENRDEIYIKNIRTNFDPFLSYGKTVKVKLTEDGVDLLKKFKYNRPNILSKEGLTYTLEASFFRAQLYFRGFLKEAEILEPPELRDWFKSELKKAYKLYENGD